MEFVVQNGDVTTWVIRVGNASNFTTATNVVATIVYPAGLTYSSHYIPQGSFNTGTGVWTVGNVFPHQILQMSITFTVSDIAQAPFTPTASVTAAEAETTYVDNDTLTTVYAVCNVVDTCMSSFPDSYICEEFTPIFGATTVTVANAAKAGYDPVVFRNGSILSTDDYTKVGNVYTFDLAFGNGVGSNFSEGVKICQHV